MVGTRQDIEKPFHDFAAQYGVEPGHVRQLATALASSPDLNARMTIALQNGEVDRFRFLDPSATARGLYDGSSDTISFNRDVLWPNPAQSAIDALVYTAGHEVEHALRSGGMQAFEAQFADSVRQFAATHSGSRDYTANVAQYATFYRNEEAAANIAGINAMASRIQKEQGSVSEQDLAERLFQIRPRLAQRNGNEFQLADGIDFDPTTQRVSGSMSSRDTVARLLVDPVGKDGHYRASHFAAAIERIGKVEIDLQARDPSREFGDIRINLGGYGIKPGMLSRRSLDFGDVPGAEFSFRDAGAENAPLVTLKQSLGARQVAHDLGSVEERSEPGVVKPTDPVYAQIEQGVDCLGTGREVSESSRARMTAALYALAKEEGIRRVDHVVLSKSRDGTEGEYAFLVNGDLRDPAHLRTQMRTSDALQAPEADALRRAEVADRSLARTAEAIDRQQTLSVAGNEQVQQGPTLAR